MSNLLKNTAKFAIGTCVTLCAVTVAASVVGTNLGKVAAAGFKGAKGAIKDELEAQRAKSNEDDAACVNEVAIESSDEVNASLENVEN